MTGILRLIQLTNAQRPGFTGMERNWDLSPGALGRYVANFARWARGGLARQRAAPIAESKTIARPSDQSEALPERVTEILCVPENARL